MVRLGWRWGVEVEADANFLKFVPGMGWGVGGK